MMTMDMGQLPQLHRSRYVFDQERPNQELSNRLEISWPLHLVSVTKRGPPAGLPKDGLSILFSLANVQ